MVRYVAVAAHPLGPEGLLSACEVAQVAAAAEGAEEETDDALLRRVAERMTGYEPDQLTVVARGDRAEAESACEDKLEDAKERGRFLYRFVEVPTVQLRSRLHYGEGTDVEAEAQDERGGAARCEGVTYMLRLKSHRTTPEDLRELLRELARRDTFAMDVRTQPGRDEQAIFSGPARGLLDDRRYARHVRELRTDMRKLADLPLPTARAKFLHWVIGTAPEQLVRFYEDEDL